MGSQLLLEEQEKASRAVQSAESVQKQEQAQQDCDSKIPNASTVVHTGVDKNGESMFTKNTKDRKGNCTHSSPLPDEQGSDSSIDGKGDRDDGQDNQQNLQLNNRDSDEEQLHYEDLSNSGGFEEDMDDFCNSELESEVELEDDSEGKHQDPGKALKALILAPTRELALQVCKQLQTIGRVCNIWVVPIVGGLAHVKQERLLKSKLMWQ